MKPTFFLPAAISAAFSLSSQLVYAEFVQKVIPVHNYATAHVERVSVKPFNGNGNVKQYWSQAARVCNQAAIEYQRTVKYPLVKKELRDRYHFNQTHDSPEYINYTEKKLDTCPPTYEATLFYSCHGEWTHE